MVGFAKRRRKLAPFMKKLELTHPELRTQGGDKTVIVLDIDELGTTGTTQNGNAAAVGASAGMLFFLSALTALAFWGTYSSYAEYKESGEQLRGLRKDRRALRKRLPGAGVSAAGRRYEARTVARMLQENSHLRGKAHTDRVFMGGFGGVGATLVGTSILANEQMLGAVVPALATAAAPLMFAATPITTVFGTGIATWEAYRFARTVRVSRTISRGLGTAVVGNEALARTLLEQRLRRLRFVTGFKGGAYLGLAIGVPLVVFGGPYGFPLMLLSAGSMVASGVLEGALTGYQPQLTFEDRLALRDRHDLTNAIQENHAKLDLLRGLRRDKKLLYPHGRDGIFPIKYLVRGTAALRRAVTGEAKGYAPARHIVYRCMDGFVNIGVQRAHNDVRATRARRAAYLRGIGGAPRTADEGRRISELEREHDAAKASLMVARRERCGLAEELRDHHAYEAACFALMRFLVKEDMLRGFGVELLRHKKLRQSFEAHRIVTRENNDWHFDANKLVLYFTRTDPAHAVGMLAHVFDVAEKVLLMVEARRTLWRERQLLDVLAEDLTTRA
ncbi:MAG TPA: hypothetical protein VFH51_19105 [Myxococcota bacterium]|nr:hypothetical protein [Myxococcota bacterium]